MLPELPPAVYELDAMHDLHYLRDYETWQQRYETLQAILELGRPACTDLIEELGIGKQYEDASRAAQQCPGHPARLCSSYHSISCTLPLWSLMTLDCCRP